MKLTNGQRKALKFLRDDEEYRDMTYEQGNGWWLGTHKTNGKLALSLMRLCLITKEQGSSFNRGALYEVWRINESGLRALENKFPYINSNGTYVDDLRELFTNK